MDREARRQPQQAHRRTTRAPAAEAAVAPPASPRSPGDISSPGRVSVQLHVNGGVYALELEPRRTLLDALRLDLHLTGTKKVCDMGECGAYTVLVDGKAVYSCLTLAIECEGRQVLTIEGLSDGVNLHPIQRAFIEHDAFQCGDCTPGQIMSVRGLLGRNPDPTLQEIRQAVSGNICRCTEIPSPEYQLSNNSECQNGIGAGLSL